MIKQLTYLSIALLLIAIISSCKPKEDDIVDVIIPETNLITAKINGEDFSVSGPFISATYSNSTEEVQTFAIVSAKAPFNGITRGIVLIIASTDSTGINSGETYTATNVDKIAAGHYTLESDMDNIRAVSDNSNVAIVTITEIDYDSKLASGTFSFDGIDNDDPGTTYQVRNGVFKDISFD